MTGPAQPHQLEPNDLKAFCAMWHDGFNRFPQEFLLTSYEAEAIPEERISGELAAGFNAFGPRPRSVLLGGTERHDVLMLCSLDTSLNRQDIVQRAAALLG